MQIRLLVEISRKQWGKQLLEPNTHCDWLFIEARRGPCLYRLHVRNVVARFFCANIGTCLHDQFLGELKITPSDLLHIRDVMSATHVSTHYTRRVLFVLSRYYDCRF